MSADTKSVDVLEVLAFHARAQECTDYPRLRSFDELECARAAIAELIEAAAQYRREFGWRGTATQERSARRIGAALARVQGGAK